MEIVAYSKFELIEKLSMSDISVPPRNKGRTNEYVERWSMYRTLATLANLDNVEYPLILTKQERPDYLLECAGVRIGCEVTTAINSDYLRTSSLPEAMSADSVIDPSLFKWDSPKKSLEELRDIANRKKLSGRPWAGNAVEREYAKIVKDVVIQKTVKMNKMGYSLYFDNVLLIYINQTLPILDTEEAAVICFSQLSDYWCSNTFSRVYVEKDEFIVQYEYSGYKIMPINNLWPG